LDRDRSVSGEFKRLSNEGRIANLADEGKTTQSIIIENDLSNSGN
jgi:hypothetical protein